MCWGMWGRFGGVGKVWTRALRCRKELRPAVSGSRDIVDLLLEADFGRLSGILEGRFRVWRVHSLSYDNSMGEPEWFCNAPSGSGFIPPTGGAVEWPLFFLNDKTG